MRRISTALVVCLLAAPGCVALTDFGALRPADAGAGLDASDLDAPARDASADASGTDGGTCPMACGPDEACCDGVCTDLTTLTDCGGCGVVCPDGENGSASCGASGCVLSCDEGWDDCDGSLGCETDLTNTSDCGACARTCATGQFCGERDGAYECLDACDAGETACGSSCTNLGTDPRNCGACGSNCGDRDGANAVCTAAGCSFRCDAGRDDCDGDLMVASGNGCETTLELQYTDADGDGFGDALAAGARRCPGPGLAPIAGDCDDRNPVRSPGARETCNGIDDNCSGGVDDGFVLNGMPTAVGDVCSCASGGEPGRVQCDGTEAVRCGYNVEVCNGLDDDCNAGPDDTFACARGASTTCRGMGAACMFTGTALCSGTCTPGTCTPPAETCDGSDENCDGFVDDGAVPFGADMAFTGVSAYSARAAWNPSGIGALVASAPGTSGPPAVPNRLLFTRFDRAGVPMGTPMVIDEDPMYGLFGDVGWDGTQWVIMYARYNTTRLVSEILRVHVSAVGVMTRPMGVVTDADSVAIAPNGSSLGVVTTRYFGSPGVGMQVGIYAAGTFSRTLAFVTTNSMTSGALVAAHGASSFVAVGTDATGLFFQLFDATGTLGGLQRPAGTPATEALAVESDGTSLWILHLNASTALQLASLTSTGTVNWNRSLRTSGFRGNLGRLGSELWVSFTDATTQRVRVSDGALAPESYIRYCDAFLAPITMVRGFCFAGPNIVPIGTCP